MTVIWYTRSLYRWKITNDECNEEWNRCNDQCVPYLLPIAYVARIYDSISKVIMAPTMT